MQSEKKNRMRRTPRFVCGEPNLSPRRHAIAHGSWRETVTHYTPEPWLVALERERIERPFRPGHRPSANR
jgi:hypothetical protein